MNCGTCKYFAKSAQGGGFCLRYPPQVLPSSPWGLFPKMREVDFCWEYAENPAISANTTTENRVAAPRKSGRAKKTKN